MIGTVAALVAGFSLLIWSSYRRARARAAEGRAFHAPGKIRWEGEDGVPTASR